MQSVINKNRNDVGAMESAGTGRERVSYDGLY